MYAFSHVNCTFKFLGALLKPPELVGFDLLSWRLSRRGQEGKLLNGTRPSHPRPALPSELGIQRDGVVLLATGAQGHEAPLFWERV